MTARPPLDPTRWPTQQGLVVTALGRNLDRPSLVDDAGTWTGPQPRANVARLSRALRASGVEPGTRVALLGGNSSWFAAAQLATGVAGGGFSGAYPTSAARGAG